MKKIKYPTSPLLMVIAGLFASVNLSAQTIAEYAFSGGSTAATSSDANLTAGAWSVGTGLTGGAGASGSSNSLFARASVTHASNQLSITNALSDNDYLSVSFTPESGYEMNLTSLSFDLGYTRNGNFNGKQFKAYLLSSATGFVDASDILDSVTITVGANTSTATYLGSLSADLSGAEFQNISSATEFRIYVADNTGNQNYLHRIDNVALNGSIASVVPEPSSFALIGGLLALCSVMLRRRA